MPWFNLSFSDFIKKRVCKFLINRYLGQFFEEKLTADQICLDLYNGKGSVYDVRLCCEVRSQRRDCKCTNNGKGSVYDVRLCCEVRSQRRDFKCTNNGNR